MASTAGFAFDHVVHAGLADDRFVWKEFCVAILAAISLGVEGVAEGGWCDSLEVEGDLFRLQAFVATIAVGCYNKCLLAVMAGTAGPSLFHFSHGHGLFLAGYDLAVVAALACSAGFGDMSGVAECGCTESFDVVSDFTGATLVATHTLFFRCDTESLHAAVASAAGFGFLHFGHCEMFSLFQVVDGVMADSAVVVIFFEVEFMAEYYWIGIFERKADIFGFSRSSTYYRHQKQ